MARAICRDNVLWFSNFLDRDDEIVSRLNALEPREAITLSVNGFAGTWRRMQNANDAPTGLRTLGVRPTGESARHWKTIPRGTEVEIVLLPESERPELIREKPAARTGLQPALQPGFPSGQTLCIGLDFAWWGGGRSRRSQTDTLVFAQINGEQASPLKLKRVDLSKTYNRDAKDTEPNCDPDAGLVLYAVQEVIARHAGEGRVVLAVDAPLRAKPREPLLPARSRKADRNLDREVKPGKRMAYRQCDQAARDALGQFGDKKWQHICKIQPGAPLCPRVEAFVNGLLTLGFQFYSGSAAEPAHRVLLECFPSEALWALGIKGRFGTVSPGEAKEYKREKIRDPQIWNSPKTMELRPWPTVLSWIYRGLYGFGHRDVLGVAEVVFTDWMADLTRHLFRDKLVMDADRRCASRGKQLDDVVESVNCFLTAVSFVRNCAHVWIGEDPADGHIIGPGL